MNGRILALLATTALVAVGCTDNDGPRGEAMGLPVGGTAKAMSADTDGDTTRVADDLASVRLSDLTYDEFGEVETVNVTFNLPDGTSVSFNEEEIGEDGWAEIGPWYGLWLYGENADEDAAWVLVGAGPAGFEPYPYDEFMEDALFSLAMVNPAGDDPDLGYNTYMVAGDKTGTLPEGSADFYGITYADVYWQGEWVDETFGYAEVNADFDGETVDLWLEGLGSETYFELVGVDLAIDGSDYGGEIDGYIETPEPYAILTGDVLGAFFGDDALATAGVFAAEESNMDAYYDGDDFDIVGGFAAYDPAID